MWLTTVAQYGFEVFNLYYSFMKVLLNETASVVLYTTTQTG
jgi:hypothetical protein